MSPASPRHPFLPALLCGLAAVAIGCGTSDDGKTEDTAGAAGAAAEASAVSESAGRAPSAAPPETRIVVNGVALSAETERQLRALYPVPIAPGRYWYDPISGGYGRDGEPIAGQMVPGLALGGALASNASRGTSGVFINSRQITRGEKAWLERLCQTPVQQGRYWILANGIGGYEGQPASFNLGQCPGMAQQGGGGRSMSRTYCDANGACTSTGILGSITTAPN